MDRRIDLWFGALLALAALVIALGGLRYVIARETMLQMPEARRNP